MNKKIKQTKNLNRFLCTASVMVETIILLSITTALLCQWQIHPSSNHIVNIFLHTCTRLSNSITFCGRVSSFMLTLLPAHVQATLDRKFVWMQMKHFNHTDYFLSMLYPFFYTCFISLIMLA